MKNIATFIQGFAIGLAELIPGMSSSTVTMLMGIYDDFINFLHSVSEFVKEFLRFLLRRSEFESVKRAFRGINLTFGVLLFLGLFTGIALLSHVSTLLLESYPTYILAFFFGVILASSAIPFRAMKVRGIIQYVIIIVTLAIFIPLLGIRPETELNEPSILLLFVTGALAITGMVLPGLNASSILLTFGLYDHIFGIIKELTQLNFELNEIIDIGIFGLGAIVGFLIVVRVAKSVLKNYEDYALPVLMGLIIASLRVIWPFLDTSSGQEIEEMVKLLPWQMPTTEIVILFMIITLSTALTFWITNKAGSHRELGKLT